MRAHRSILGRIIAATALLASGALVALPSTAGAAPNEGSLSGTVLDHTGNPLPDVCVELEGHGSDLTDTAGHYGFSDVPIGDYVLRYTDCSPTPSYLQQYYRGQTDRDQADPVTVTDQSGTTLGDVTMELGVRVTGTVTDDLGSPIQGISVLVLPDGPDRWTWNPRNHSQVTTDATGSYTSGLVGSGNYDVLFRHDQDPPSYAEQWYSGVYIEDQATTIALDATSNTLRPGIDAQLEAPVSISGTVRDTGGAGLDDICVEAAWGDPDDHAANTRTGADGTWSLTGLPPGSTYLYFHDCASAATHQSQWYDGQPNSDNATPITLNAGSGVGDIDVTLHKGDLVTGNVTDTNGNPVANVDIHFDGDHGNSGWARTDASGNYTSSPLADDDYRVKFSPQTDHATQYWQDSPTWEAAAPLAIDGSGPITDVDAQLDAASRITGTVTDPAGDPVEGICVGTLIGTDEDPGHVDRAETDANGNYLFDHLPAGTYRVYFHDCSNVGPYLDEFFDSTHSFSDATSFKLSPGDTQGQVDAQLEPAGLITGTVRDAGGTPLEEICVQASTDDFTGNMTRTEWDGTYRLAFDRTGSYRIQFLDCGDEEDGRPGGKFQASWWGGGTDPASAVDVDVSLGDHVPGIDAALSIAGGTGTVSGQLTNVRGGGLAACVALYAPFDAVRFRSTDPDGKYTFENVPTGTWTLAFLGCPGPGEEDPSPLIPAGDGTGVFFPAAWLGGAPLEITEDGPDPIEQGAQLLTVNAGDDLTADRCFGCETVQVDPPEVGEDHITVTFNSTGLVDAGPNRAGMQASLDYSVACRSDRGTATSTTVAGPTSARAFPVRVSGFTPGAPYVCSARVLSNGVEVANARTFEVTVGQAVDPDASTPTDPTASQPDNGPRNPDDAAPITPRSLAFTGRSTTAIAVGAGLLTLAGIAMLFAASRLSTVHARRRATS